MRLLPFLFNVMSPLISKYILFTQLVLTIFSQVKKVYLNSMYVCEFTYFFLTPARSVPIHRKSVIRKNWPQPHRHGHVPGPVLHFICLTDCSGFSSLVLFIEFGHILIFSAAKNKVYILMPIFHYFFQIKYPCVKSQTMYLQTLYSFNRVSVKMFTKY